MNRDALLDKLQSLLNPETLQATLLPLLLNLLLAAAIYFIGKWIAGHLVRLLGRVMVARKVDPVLQGFLLAIASTLLTFVIILIALEQTGVNTTSLLALLGAAGLAVGLALKDSLSNFAAGVMLIIFKPFKLGDWVEAGGVAGIVEGITVFNTIFRSGDNKEIIVPNAQIYGGTIINFNARATRRIDLIIGVSYEDDLKKTRALILEVLNSDERILAEPAPVVAVDALAESSVNFIVRPWVKTEDYWAVRWHLLEAIKLSFDENDITIPYPQRDVHLHTSNVQVTS